MSQSKSTNAIIAAVGLMAAAYMAFEYKKYFSEILPKSTSSAVSTQSSQPAPPQQAAKPVSPFKDQVNKIDPANRLNPPTNLNATSQIKIEGQGFTQAIEPKKKGEWVVDINKGSGYDTESISTALFNAEPNDIIRIRPGTYKEALKFTKKATLIGDDRDKVIIEDSGSEDRDTVIIKNQEVRLESLTLTNANVLHSKTSLINAKASTVDLEKVRIKSGELKNTVLVTVRDGTKLTANNCIFESSKGEGLFISNNDTGSVTVANSEFNFLGAGIGAMRSANITVTNSKFSNLNSEAISSMSSRLKLSGLKIENAYYGINFRDESIVELENTKIDKVRRPFRIVASIFKSKNLDIRDITSPLSIAQSEIDLENLKVDTSSLGALQLESVTGFIKQAEFSNIGGWAIEIRDTARTTRINMTNVTVRLAPKGISAWKVDRSSNPVINSTNVYPPYVKDK